MALEQARTMGARDPKEGFRQRLSRRWHSAIPALLLAATLVVSLLGLYALGRSVQDWVGRPGAQLAAPSTAQDAGSLAKSLTRLGWSHPDVPADVLLVTPDYFQAVGWAAKADMNPRDHLIVMVAENVHDGDLPAFDLPQLWINGSAISETPHTKVMADSPHHRTTAVIFDKPASLVKAPADTTIGLTFPDAGNTSSAALTWDGAVLGESTSGAAAFHLTAASILAILAGMIASMWPCLFQLTAYFIPSLAGISMSEARGPVSSAVRWRVVKMAVFFVAGFVIVYTLAGAAAGLASQSFDTQSIFETWRRPFTIVAGAAMLVMALRQLARARLPLVCKMPLMVRVGKTSQPGYGSAMLMGLAYATGCATCFGAAVLLGILVYVGVAGAPFTGAAVMFLFSVGMGIPLVIGASLMARVLPLLARFDQAARYLALVSGTIMLAMAVLLLSDHFMGFSNEITQILGGGVRPT